MLCPAPSFAWVFLWGTFRQGEAFCFRGGGTAGRLYFRAYTLSRFGSARERARQTHTCQSVVLRDYKVTGMYAVY